MLYTTNSPIETQKLASFILKRYLKNKKQLFFFIYGELGSGKTEFVKGVARSLRFNNSQVRSPTFITIAELENKNFKLFHLDFYKVDKKFSDRVLHDLLEEQLNTKKKKIFCFEWSEKLSNKIKKLVEQIDSVGVISVKIKILDSTKRKIYINEKR